jgi:hypothetical protein
MGKLLTILGISQEVQDKLPICSLRGGQLTVPQAKNLLLRNGLPTNGNKAQLCQRLIENNLARPNQHAPAPAPAQGQGQLPICSALTVVQIKDLLRQRGLPTNGNKPELCQRLIANHLARPNPERGQDELPICRLRGGQLNVPQAKELLRRNGLPTAGTKHDLCQRLIRNNLAAP